MKLKRLEISGFKSFVDPVKTDFSKGITAIVGPNGCGKSNFSDAINWVLGEQSPKSMRGGSMADVIFNGSEKRGPLGMCEVSLALDPEGLDVEGTENGEIIIGRRLFRSGESQYRLNDKTVRLKEIRDILMDTGLGLRAYSVIEQGRIGQILSGKPQERRKLIEEAAGVTRYKQRKRLAEIKLEDATANRMRLDDIIAEVERALRSLKRQANAAVRFKEREGEYRALLERVLIERWRSLQEKLDELTHRIDQGIDVEAEQTAELSQKEAALAEARERLEELSRELAEKHQHQADLGAKIEGRQQFVRGARQTTQEIEERLENGKTIAEQRHQEIETHRSSLEALEQRAEQLFGERDAAASTVERDQQLIAAAEGALKTVASRLEEVRGRMMTSLGNSNALQSKLHQEQIEREKAAYRRERAEQELIESRDDLSKINEELAEADKGLGQLREQFTERRDVRAALEQTIEGLEGREASLRHQSERTSEEKRTYEQRKAVLQELAEADVRRRNKIREALARLGVEDPRFLDDVIEVPAGWEDSLDLYLDQLRDAVLVPDDEDPLALARALSADRSQGTLLRPGDPDRKPQENGRSGPRFLGGGNGAPRPFDPFNSEAPSRSGLSIRDAGDDPAVVTSLGEALGLSREFACSLPPAYLVESAEDAERLALDRPGTAFISRDRLWAHNGVLHVQGDEAIPGVLARNREMQDIEDRLPGLVRRLEELSEEIAAVSQEKAERTEKRDGIDREISEINKTQAVASARQQDASARRDKAQQRYEKLALRQKQLSSELEQHSERREALQRQLEAAVVAHQEMEGLFDTVQTEVDERRQEREALRTTGAGHEGRLQLLRERVDSHDSETRRLRQQIGDVEGYLSQWQSEEHRLGERRTDLLGQIEEAETDLQSSLEQRSAAEEETLAAQQRLDGHRQQVKNLEEAVVEQRENRDGGRGALEQLRVEQATVAQDVGHVRELFREEFERSLPETVEAAAKPTEAAETVEDEEAETPPEPVVIDLAEMEAELRQRKEVLDRMGPVNVLAAEEYQEQLERHGFLTEQRADVQESILSLRSTIQEINETSSTRFKETFEEVNKTFGESFVKLFRGGEGYMRLLDEDDPLETGIEIVARPPGKKLQNIMLMSGGEKALTAIALLFALFQTKPSPFCILDEVDAPLDDANVLRFVDTLKSMSEDTQFLVVTHNKLTMEAASSLYGVTMEEKGVSKLVGVDVDELHPEDALQTA
ncbi:MAG: AAA family ATPase [Acidobacteriota bacterium]